MNGKGKRVKQHATMKFINPKEIHGETVHYADKILEKKMI